MSAVSVQLMTAGHWSRAKLMDLSLWGAGLLGDKLPAAGARAQLQLSLAGRATRIETTVAWGGGASPGAGLAFDPLSSVARRVLAEALLLEGYQDDAVARRAVLLLVNGSPRAPELAKAIRARGFELSVSATPLEAIRRLGEPGPTVRAAIVSGALARGAELLGFLASEHPDVRRVLLLEASGPMSSAAVDAHLAERVLLAPWTADDLDAIFDLIRDRPLATFA